MKKWSKMSENEQTDAVRAALVGGAKTRTEIINIVDVTDVGELDRVLQALVDAGRAKFEEGGSPDGFDVWEPVEENKEETRPVADRRLLRRITPARRAELNAEDAELSREEAKLERIIVETKERLKATHERRMTAALASESETEYADVPCKEILRFSASLAFTVRCDDPAEWPEGTPEDGVVGDPRTLTAEDMQTVLPMDGAAVDMEAVASICGAAGVEEKPAEKKRGRGRPKKGGGA